jgi:hypothetical protein
MYSHQLQSNPTMGELRPVLVKAAAYLPHLVAGKRPEIRIWVPFFGVHGPEIRHRTAPATSTPPPSFPHEGTHTIPSLPPIPSLSGGALGRPGPTPPERSRERTREIPTVFGQSGRPRSPPNPPPPPSSLPRRTRPTANAHGGTGHFLQPEKRPPANRRARA